MSRVRFCRSCGFALDVSSMRTQTRPTTATLRGFVTFEGRIKPPTKPFVSEDSTPREILAPGSWAPRMWELAEAESTTKQATRPSFSTTHRAKLNGKQDASRSRQRGDREFSACHASKSRKGPPPKLRPERAVHGFLRLRSRSRQANRHAAASEHGEAARNATIRPPYRGEREYQAWFDTLDAAEKKAALQRQLRYAQWGYLRHQYTGAERKAAHIAWQNWCKRFDLVMRPKNPSSWPWLRDGEWIFGLDSVSSMREAWAGLDAETQKQNWPSMMLSTLHLHPSKAPMVLDATLDPLPPGYAIGDVLHYIANWLPRSKDRYSRTSLDQANDILGLLSTVLESLPANHIRFEQRTLGLYARKLPSGHAKQLHDILERTGQKLHLHTRLHFAWKLARDSPHKSAAFRILQILAEDGVDLNNSKVASVITTLLYLKPEDRVLSPPKDSFSPRNALQYFTEMGFRPNTIALTALIGNLCQSGEVEETTRLALLFAESGVQLDAKVCTTVFKGAKDSLVAGNVARALDVAKVSSIPFIEVLNSMLHAVYYFAEMGGRQRRLKAPWILPLFIPLLQVYAKRFDLAPLQSWLPDMLPPLLKSGSDEAEAKFGDHSNDQWDFHDSILPLADGFFSQSDGPRVQPNSTTLATMLRAYIKSLRSPYDLVSFYSHFKSRLEEPGDAAAALIRDQGTLIHDTFILAMMERKELTGQALRVFGDMLRDSLKGQRPEGAKAQMASDEDQQRARVHPGPSLYTFNIVLSGLRAAREWFLADKTAEAMAEHGLEPNLATWNTLIKVYASAQRIPKTVEALQDMEVAGFQPDAFTFRAFGRLKDQRRALEKMESIIDSNAKKLVEEGDISDKGADKLWGMVSAQQPSS